MSSSIIDKFKSVEEKAKKKLISKIEVRELEEQAILENDMPESHKSLMKSRMGDHKIHSVTQSNELVRSSQKLSIQEKRLIVLAIAQINPMETSKRLEYRVKAKDFAEFFNIKSKAVYSELQKACSSLFDRSYKTYNKNKKLRIEGRWVQRVTYFDDKGEVLIKFAEDVMPHLQGLAGKFSSYRLNTLPNFSTNYVWRMFELMNSVKRGNSFSGFLDITLDELRHALEIPDSYSYGNIKQRILNKAISEMIETMQVDIELIEKKDSSIGRGVVAIRMVFEERKQGLLF
ncbi:replication initiation protein [Thiomicrospira microaerophila]|uniref:replication initiation protein n=1 Tax=Thiomicrospira microaerophila TaxID=406020 RepID=UPI0005CABEF9|nr:replication initiation protein [Thiomicrospira microaerophila]